MRSSLASIVAALGAALALSAGLGACVLDLNDDTDAPRQCGGWNPEPCEDNEYCDYPPEARCGETDGGGVCRSRPLLCPEIYAPVVACNGEIYDNACEAHARGFDDARPAPVR